MTTSEFSITPGLLAAKATQSPDIGSTAWNMSTLGRAIRMRKCRDDWSWFGMDITLAPSPGPEFFRYSRRLPLFKYLSCESMIPNLPIDADPQQHAAASPLMLVVRSSLR
jgi:hypothetical protein